VRLGCNVAGAILVAASCVLSTVVQAASANADQFPVRPIRFIVPFVAGVGTDLTARTIAAKPTERWGQQVVVDNRPGAAGAIGVDIPTIAEQGVAGYEVDQWYGIATSAKVPITIVSKLSQAIAESVRSPEIAQRWATDGTIPVGSTHEQFNVHVRTEVAKWRKLVKDTNLELHQ
jgi:tripartite-type tricarboxylate transporter receptor subunit TctC